MSTRASSPVDVLSTLGTKIRSARERRGILLKDLAAKCGVTPSLLSQVERGLANPSLNTLRSVAESLDVPLVTFFEEPPSEEEVIVRHGRRRNLTLPGGGAVYEMLSPRASRQLEVGIMVLQPKQTSVDRAMAHKTDEVSVVLEGTVDVEMDGHMVHLLKGDSVLLSQGTRHRWYNPGSEPTRVLFAISPPSF